MKMNVLFTLNLVWLGLVIITEACTEIRVVAKDGTVIVGRTMEFEFNLESYVVVEPVDKSHKAYMPSKCRYQLAPMKWQNKYVVTYLNAWGTNMAVDGMNNAGLSVGALLFPGFAEYEELPENKCPKGGMISHLELPLWLLSTFATVQEVQDTIDCGSFPLVFQRNLRKGDPRNLLPLHYSIQDKTGDAIVLEYTKNGRAVYNNPVGAVTNSPPYDFHMMNFRNYVQLSNYNNPTLILGDNTFNQTGQGSGLIGIPGDFTPPSRLIRAGVTKSFATPTKTSKEAVNLVFHVLNDVDIPRGVLRESPENTIADSTWWTVVKDLKNAALYYHDYNDLTIRVLHMNNLDNKGVVGIKVEAPEVTGFVDITEKMAPIRCGGIRCG